MLKNNFYYASIFLILFFTRDLLSNETAIEDSKVLRGNRLIFQIEELNFTQIDIESYFLVKGLLNNQDRDKIPIKEKNWENSLNIFQEDMITYLNQRKLGRTLQGFENLPEKTDKIYARILEHISLNVYRQRLGITKKQVRKSLAYHLFVRSNQNLQKNSNLQRKYEKSFYQGAKNYRYIQMNFLKK